MNKQTELVLELLEIVGPSQENVHLVRETLIALEQRRKDFDECWLRHHRFEKRADSIDGMNRNGSHHSLPEALFAQYEEDCVKLNKPVYEYKHIERSQ
tara:strand:+ start:720 stop:1013 length:294 start_codon:yes stop_codon:yes gene_type:complete